MWPARMNTVEIVVRKLSKERTHWDPDFEEPVTKKDRSEEVVLRGQVNLGKAGAAFERRSPSLTGDRSESDGHLVFRKADLDAAAVRLAKGDRVVRIAGEPVDFLLTEVRPESPLRGGFLLVYAEFAHNREERASL
jgi:hypothetical protein